VTANVTVTKPYASKVVLVYRHAFGGSHHANAKTPVDRQRALVAIKTKNAYLGIVVMASVQYLVATTYTQEGEPQS
jgi:hypothetical protein